MKVLMATMQLDIGGAETHIVELSKALKKRGVDVYVASRGGVYEEELKQAGIPHYFVPLNSKNFSSMRKSYKTLKALIKKEKFDIVHAHARIPAFILGLIKRSLNFRFVTTAHWVFNSRFPLNLLTNWGEKSLAVSDDIKDYLIKNYHLSGDDIRVTINGIDTEKFSKGTDYSDIKEEFDLKDGKTRIVYCSRMDTDRSLAAHRLIEIAPTLFEKIDNLEIVIVGGGNDLSAIKDEADKVNNQTDKAFIKVTGSRRDRNKFAASADLFIGVSRAALEAMAAEVPSIIAGNEGYIGIFSPDKLKVSIDTNFCCRGEKETDSNILLADILSLLENIDESKLSELGTYARETVKKYYSLETMANDALKMYSSVINNTKINEISDNDISSCDKVLPPYTGKNIMISGYYGFRNSGDDSILSGIVEELRKNLPGAKITVLSKNPSETSAEYGVYSVDRLNFFKISNLLNNTDLFISGGGSLLQDMTSSKSLAYYLSVIMLAKLKKVKTFIYANGIGPIQKERNKKWAKKVLNDVDIITLREEASLKELIDMNVDTKNTYITADPVYTIESESMDMVNRFLSESGICENDKYFVLSVRPWTTMKPNFVKEVSDFLNKVQSTYNLTPVVISMQPTRDTLISKSITEKLDNKFVLIDKNLSSAMLLGILKRAEFCCGMRLHTLIYAAKVGTPSIGIAYDPKVTAMLDYTGQSYKIDVEKVSSDKLYKYASEILENIDEIKTSLYKRSYELTYLAEKNALFAKELIK